MMIPQDGRLHKGLRNNNLVVMNNKFIFIKLFVTVSTPVQQQDQGVMRYNADSVLETVTRPTKIGKLNIVSYYDEMKSLSFIFTLSCE